MRIIAITPPYFYPGEAESIGEALRQGRCDRLHLRKPGATEEQVRHLIEEIDSDLYPRITIHGFHHLAAEYRLGGIHLNSACPNPPEGWNGLTSRSLHSVEEIKGLTDEDYAFISPVFDSISKPGYQTPFSIEELEENITHRVYALGGVVPDRMPLLEFMGFKGCAMMGAFWRQEIDPDKFKLQFITNRAGKGKDIPGSVREVLEGGCRWVQLRCKEADSDELAALADELLPLCRQAGATFIIDDHVDIVRRCGADGVHLGKNDMPVAEARRILGPCKIIGATANTFDDLLAAVNAGADYVGLGPFRFTTTKKNLSPILGLKGYTEIMRRCRHEHLHTPVVAIGGIEPADVRPIMLTGVKGVAISSAITGSENPRETTALFGRLTTPDTTGHSCPAMPRREE